jgi:hypothetical protein
MNKLETEIKLEIEENGGEFKIYYIKLNDKIKIIKRMILISFDK